VQLTDGAAINAANWSFMDGKGIAGSNSRIEVHHRAIRRQE
jgi:hypothetical protein